MKEALVHLREGEIEKLVHYLWLSEITVEEEDAELRNYVPDEEGRCTIKHHLDQTRAEILQYERNSTFGINRNEIYKSARNHLESCGYCMTQYEVHIKRVIKTLENAKGKILEQMGKKKFDSSGALERQVRIDWDVLNLLKK